MRILIADDDLTARTALAGVLRKAGHEVVICVDGGEAWQTLQSPNAPPLVILDWMMPTMDGLEVVRHLRGLETECPPHILMLTSRSDKADIVKVLDAGANDYLTKPFDTGELRARIAVGVRMIEMQTALSASREALVKLAAHDSLTGMLNRGAVLKCFEHELERISRSSGACAVGLCDIDDFKQINDKYGHQTGDDVLHGFAHVLQFALRPYDVVGRWGGEEFLLILPTQEPVDNFLIFDRLRKVIAEAVLPTRSGPLSVTVSIGVVEVQPGRSAEQILGAADDAMYQAKRQGRNCIRIHR